MKKQKQAINVLYPILVFWTNRKSFFSFLFLIVLPLLLISSGVWYFSFSYPTSRAISSVFIGIAYFLMFLFTVSFTVLYKISREIEISFIKTLKLIPVISKKVALIAGGFALLIIFIKELFFLAPYVLLIIFPIVSFLSIYKSSVNTKELFAENKTYLSNPSGKGLIGKMIILAVFLIIAVGVTNLILDIIFSFAYNSFLFQILNTVKLFLRFFAFFILYLFANVYYADENFSIPKEVNVAALNILSEKKKEREKRTIKTRRDSKEKEINRFDQDGEYNRFEDTNF